MFCLLLIGVIVCIKQIGFYFYYIVGDKYLCVVVNGVGGFLLIIFVLGELIDQVVLLDSVDGLFFIGLLLNVEFCYYSGLVSEFGIFYDFDCDVIMLLLVCVVIDVGILVFGICCGFQEMNVVFGGSLYQKVYEVGIFMDYCELVDQLFEVQYVLCYVMYVQLGGVFVGIGLLSEFQVNFIYGQGVDCLVLGF